MRPVSEKGRRRRAARAAQARVEGGAFRDAIRGERCVVCRRTEREALEGGARHEAHHAIAAARLRRLGREDLLWSPELALCVCSWPCHEGHTTARARLTRSMIPAPRWERLARWAASEGLLDVLQRELPA